jgi:negative regulator of flagellin synthesis FlgM
MKIHNLTQTQQAATKAVKDAGPAQQVQPQAQQQGATQEARDRVELSPLAKDLQKAAEIAQATPEVRADKVAALKAKIESGTYEIDSQKVASKMIVDSLSKLT